MILYDYERNRIMAHHTKNWQSRTIVNAYKILHLRLCRFGLKTHLQQLNNKCSTLLKTWFITITLTSRLCHLDPWTQFFRKGHSHFKKSLYCRPLQSWQNFPIHIWYDLLPQAEITFSLLCGSRIYMKLSTWAQLHSTFDFNCTNLIPPRCHVIYHKNTDKSKTRTPHGLDGWYVGPALNSYSCHTIWIWETRVIHINYTLTWFPIKVKLPANSYTDIFLICLQDILNALQHPVAKSPLASWSENHTQTLHHLVSLISSLPPIQPSYSPRPLQHCLQPRPTHFWGWLLSHPISLHRLPYNWGRPLWIWCPIPPSLQIMKISPHHVPYRLFLPLQPLTKPPSMKTQL